MICSIIDFFLDSVMEQRCADGLEAEGCPNPRNSVVEAGRIPSPVSNPPLDAAGRRSRFHYFGPLIPRVLLTLGRWGSAEACFDPWGFGSPPKQGR